MPALLLACLIPSACSWTSSASAPAGTAPSGAEHGHDGDGDLTDDHDHDAEGNAQEGATPAAGTFLGQFRMARADYDPSPTTAALAERSTVVMMAHLEEIREGRILGTSATDPARAEHLVYVFRTGDVRRGRYDAPRVFVEALKPDFSPATDFDRLAPRGAEAVLYLQPRPPLDPAEPVVGDDAGLDPGATAHWFTTPQGFLLDEGGTVIHPLEPRTGTPLFPQQQLPADDLHAWLP